MKMKTKLNALVKVLINKYWCSIILWAFCWNL